MMVYVTRCITKIIGSSSNREMKILSKDKHIFYLAYGVHMLIGVLCIRVF